MDKDVFVIFVNCNMVSQILGVFTTYAMFYAVHKNVLGKDFTFLAFCHL